MYQPRRKGGIMIYVVCSIIVVTIIVLLLVLNGKRERIVGKQIASEEITEFMYTYATAVYPPEYQRYRFYMENGKYQFFHEKREGKKWPLSEADITVCGTRELSAQEWKEFLDCVTGGSVIKRERNPKTAKGGAFCYLYWNGDRSRYQEFGFPSLNARKGFEDFCAELVY